jgi:predicted nucleic acid-binding protein
LENRNCIVFDSQPILSYFLQEEPAAARVEKLVNELESGKLDACINIINLIELHYILARAGKDDAEQSITGSGIKIIPLTLEDGIWQIAAELKVNYAISLADACAAATAIILDCQLVVGADPEFKLLENADMLKVIRV